MTDDRDDAHEPEADERTEDPDRDAILRRRSRFIAVALSSALAGSAGIATTACACLGAPVRDAGTDAAPRPCLSDAGRIDPDAGPQPCLSPPLPDGGPDAGDLDGGDPVDGGPTDGGEPDASV